MKKLKKKKKKIQNKDFSKYMNKLENLFTDSETMKVVCLVGKNRRRSSAAEVRRLWTRGRLYDSIEISIGGQVLQYYTTTNLGTVEPVTIQEFKKRFRRFI